MTSQPKVDRPPSRGRHQIVAGAALAALLVVGLAILLITTAGGGRSTPAQQRTVFASMVKRLRFDLRECTRDTAHAVSTFRRAEEGGGSKRQAIEGARVAAAACVPATDTGIWNLSLYAVPDPVRNRTLDYGVSCLGVWAQFEVAPAMKDIEKALDGDSESAAIAGYELIAKGAASVKTIADSAFQQEAVRLRQTGVQPISLPSLQLAS